MVVWKTHWSKPSIVDGSPVPQGGYLDLEGPDVFQRIAGMPKGIPLTPRELDLLFHDFLERCVPGEMGVAISYPLLWAMVMGYHIVYDSSDYTEIHA